MEDPVDIAGKVPAFLRKPDDFVVIETERAGK
jgi:hypothetical protein